MGVISKNYLDNSYRYFIKGAPEKIVNFCKPLSLPENFNESLLYHTKNGFRVLACASKPINYNEESEIDEDRSKYDNDLNFLGLIIFKNKLKKDTKHIIEKLNISNCKMVMATGDNPFTAISVARECDLLSNNDELYLLDFEKDQTLNTDKLTLYFLIN